MKSIFYLQDLKIEIQRRKNVKRIIFHPTVEGYRITAGSSISVLYIKEVLQNILLELEPQRADLLAKTKRFTQGEQHKLFGKSYSLQKQKANHNRVEIQGGSLLVFHKENADIEKLLQDFSKKELLARALPLLAKYAELMQVQVRELRIKNMKTRWGTCNIKEKRIWLSLMLAEWEEECLAYVIVHELAHLFERGHNARFYAIVEKYYPNYKAVVKRMRNFTH